MTLEQFTAKMRERGAGEPLDAGLIVIAPCDPDCGVQTCEGWRLVPAKEST